MAKILVVDDDKDILRLLEYTITRAGHTVITSSEGSQGLAVAEEERPDLIVADVMMPTVTGYEFCRRIRTNSGLAEVPIIIFSARFQPVDKQTALEAGATDYLPKSIAPDVLVRRIGELLPTAGEPASSNHSVIGLFSLRGGTGITSLAVNLAVALALGRRTPLALVDLAPLGGHAALLLGLRPVSSVSNALNQTAGNITLDLLRSHLLQHNSGVYLLPSALHYDQQLPLTDGRLAPLIATLKSGFPFTILDIPSRLDPAFTPVFQLLDKLLLVLSNDMASLQSTALALTGLARLGVAESKIIPVVNNVAAQGGLPLEIIQKTLKRPVLLQVPYDPEIIKAINSGKPFLLGRPQSTGAAAVGRLAQILISENTPG